jgi:hypothetical protein
MKTSRGGWFASFREQSRRRRLHAAVKRLPVYEIERLAYTDAANLLPVNPVKPRRLSLKLFCRWLRFRIRRHSFLP